jgi:hypothetical protein
MDLLSCLMTSCLIFSGGVDTEGDTCALWTVASQMLRTSHFARHSDVDAFCLVLRIVLKETHK